MAKPTADQKAAIKAAVSDWAGTNAEIAAELNARTVPNPTPAPQVAPALDALALVQLLGAESLEKLERAGLIPSILADIRTQDRDALGGWVVYCAARGHITPDEAKAIGAAAQAMVDAPDWPVELPWASVTLGREVDADDVKLAR